jgi:glycosyltransferase involved in cell wall biosynthesis
VAPTLICFVVIAYNEERSVADCVEAILRQEAPGVDLRVLVIDDASTDGTAEVVRKIASDGRVRLIQQPRNAGRGAARAAGVAAALGVEYIAMVDADILLPPDWLARTLHRFEVADTQAVGGTAVPDGDVAWVHRALGLTPRPTRATTTITGNNGLYRAAIFGRIGFDSLLREGEDVAFNYAMTAQGFRAELVPDLLVEHREHKTYMQSVRWLFQSGMGATRQLWRYRRPRPADAATVFFWLSMFAWRPRQNMRAPMRIAIPFVALLGGSFVHLRGRYVFQAHDAPRSAAAVVAYAPLLAAYFVGRLAGLARLITWTPPDEPSS